MQRIEAGSPFDVVIVCNGGDLNPLVLPPGFESLNIQVFNRENTHYNQGAWDHGWRAVAGYEFFLMVQDECTIVSPGWVEQFEFRITSDLQIGLLGEQINWTQMSWAYVREATDRDLGNSVWPANEPLHPIDSYQQMMMRRGIDKGQEATYLNSIILFTSRKVLEEVGGFPFMGLGYREAVGCEIAFSRVIASRGYKVTRIRGTDFAFLSHRQWAPSSLRWVARRNKLRQVLHRLGLRAKPQYHQVDRPQPLAALSEAAAWIGSGIDRNVSAQVSYPIQIGREGMREVG